jgi:hypothetical protein
LELHASNKNADIIFKLVSTVRNGVFKGLNIGDNGIEIGARELEARRTSNGQEMAMGFYLMKFLECVRRRFKFGVRGHEKIPGGRFQPEGSVTVVDI